MSPHGASKSGVRTFRADDHHLRVDFDAASVLVNQHEVPLTPTQYRVLACLAANAGVVMSSAEIVADVWGDWYGSDDNLFVYIHHIRAKLGPCARLIRTKRTMGYILQGDPPPDGQASGAAGATSREFHRSDAVDDTSRYLLTFDLESRLVGIAPDGPFLGWEIERILGSPFAIAGLDLLVVERIVNILRRAADGVVDGPQSVTHADGRRIPVRPTLHLSLLHGSHGGYSIELLMDDEPSGVADDEAGQP